MAKKSTKESKVNSSKRYIKNKNKGVKPGQDDYDIKEITDPELLKFDYEYDDLDKDTEFEAKSNARKLENSDNKDKVSSDNDYLIEKVFGDKPVEEIEPKSAEDEEEPLSFIEGAKAVILRILNLGAKQQDPNSTPQAAYQHMERKKYAIPTLVVSLITIVTLIGFGYYVTTPKKAAANNGVAGVNKVASNDNADSKSVSQSSDSTEDEYYEEDAYEEDTSFRLHSTSNGDASEFDSQDQIYVDEFEDEYGDDEDYYEDDVRYQGSYEDDEYEYDYRTSRYEDDYEYEYNYKTRSNSYYDDEYDDEIAISDTNDDSYYRDSRSTTSSSRSLNSDSIFVSDDSYTSAGSNKEFMSENGLKVNSSSTEMTVTGDSIFSNPNFKSSKNAAFTTVDESYFEDALFIGDSRMYGFSVWSELPATFYGGVGFQLYNYENANVAETDSGKKPILEAIPYDTFTKIYIKVGLNEMGWGSEEQFESLLSEFVDRLRQSQPRAVIYIHGLIPVTASQNAIGDTHNNSNIISRNTALASFAPSIGAYFLNVGEAYADANGCLPDEYSSDGIHLKAQCVNLWKDYLMTHAIMP